MSSNGDNNKNKQPSPVDQMVKNLAANSYTADGQYNQLGFAQPQPQSELYSLPRVVHNGYNNYMLPEQPLPQEQPMYSSPNGHYVQQNYVLPQPNIFLNDSRYEKHANTDYMYQNLNMSYQPYLNFAADNNFVYDAAPQQFNAPQSANSNQFLESLSGHWNTTNNTGTYSPFGNSNLFDSESKLPHKHNEIPVNIELPTFNQFGTVRETSNPISVTITGQQQQMPKKPRAIAEVKPMRPSYSAVLLKSAPAVGNSTNKIGNSYNNTSEIKESKLKAKEKDGNNKKSNKSNDKLSKNSLNRSNTTNEIKDIPTDKCNIKKVNAKPVVHHQLNRKWASLDNVTNEQVHSFNKPEPIDPKPKNVTKSSTPKSGKKTPKSYDKLPNFTDTSNKQTSNACCSHADSESSSSQSNFNTNNTKTASSNDNGNNSASKQVGGNVGLKKGNSGSGIRVVRQRNYEQPERDRQSAGKRGGQRGGKVKKDCNMPLGFLIQYCRQYLSEWWKILIRFIFWLYHLIFDICSMSTTITVDSLYSFRDWILHQYALFSACLSNVDQNPFLYLWNKIRRKKPIPDETTRTNSNTHVAGLQHNINMPTTGEEAMKRLLACKGKDPYSILGVTADCSDEDIRRYYRRQAFLVHPDKNQQPGAEEAFKILVHAFDMIGVAERREAYDRGVAESVQVEQAWSELTTLLAQLQAKVAAAANTIRCSTCSSRHKRTRLTPPRPVYAARWCAQCRIRHGAREGDIWAESVAARIAERENGNGNNHHGGVSTDSSMSDGSGSGHGDGGANILGKWWVYLSGGWRWRYYACMEGAVYDVTEWAACQRESLKHLKADQHCVQYRIALGKQQHQSSNSSNNHHTNSGSSGNNSSASTSKRHRNSGANYANQSGASPDLEHLLNSLYGQTEASTKAGTTSSNGNATGQDGGGSNCATSNIGQRRRSRKNK